MPTTYRTNINNSGLLSLIQDGEGAHWTHDKAKAIEMRARAFAPERTGRLKASHVTLPTTGSNQFQKVYRISALAPYAKYVHQGTGPRIYPRGQYLKIPHSVYNTGRTPKMVTIERRTNRAGKGYKRETGLMASGLRARKVRGSTFVRSVAGQKPQPWLLEAAASVLGGV